MALIVDGESIYDNGLDGGLEDFYKTYEADFAPRANEFKSMPLEKVSKQMDVLYVSQHELGIIAADSACLFSKLGTDMATTCYMVSLYHTHTKVAALAHFDGSDTQDGVACLVNNMMDEICYKTVGKLIVPVAIDLHIIGGFSDPGGMSDEVSLELLRRFNGFRTKPGVPAVLFNMETFCCSKLNNTKVECSGEMINSPVIRGIVLDAKTGRVNPAWFDDKAKTPVFLLRGARCITGVATFPNIFNWRNNRFTLEAFMYAFPIENIPNWLKQPSEKFLEEFSTSPRVEADNFCELTKAMLQFILDNPDPTASIFHDQKAVVYQAVICQDEITWQKVQP